MQTIKTIDGMEFLLENNEAEYIKSIIATQNFINLSSGDMINTKSIARIGQLDKIATYDGAPISRDRTHFFRDGKRINIGENDTAGIEMLDDPKYISMSPVKLLKEINK
jgi:hypothetical protein